MARAAAEGEQVGRRQIRGVDEDARPEAEIADAPSRLVRDDAANGEGGLADGDLVAHRDAERREQFRSHEDAPVLQHRVGVGSAALEREPAVEREAAIHRAQFRHPGHRPARVDRPHHRRGLDGFGLRGGAEFLETPVDGGPRLRRPVAVGRDQHVGRNERAGLGAEDGADALDDGADRHDRRDADGNADEEEQEPPPRRARLAHGHAEDKHQTTLPSRSEMDVSAMAASSGSWVTRISVVLRDW